MPWKYESVKGKVPEVLKAAGLELPADKADAAVGALASLMPEQEVFTREETQDEIRAAREEAKAVRETMTALLEKVTGMRRDSFKESDRQKSMLTAAEQRMQDLVTQNEALKAENEPLKAKVAEFTKKETEMVAAQFSKIKDKIVAILAVEENAKRFGSLFPKPADGKAYTTEEQAKLVIEFNKLKELGVPAFQPDAREAEEGGEHKKEKTTPNRTMTAKQLAEKRRGYGIH